MHSQIIQNIFTRPLRRGQFFSLVSKQYVFFELSIGLFLSEISGFESNRWVHVELSNQGKFLAPDGVGEIEIFGQNINYRDAGVLFTYLAFSLYGANAETRCDQEIVHRCNIQKRKLKEFLAQNSNNKVLFELLEKILATRTHL